MERYLIDAIIEILICELDVLAETCDDAERSNNKLIGFARLVQFDLRDPVCPARFMAKRHQRCLGSSE